jgi:pSer/pThr/pTyr-binding forkhead associated (FHA) protein
MHFLLISSGTGDSTPFDLAGEKTVIGRHPSCDLVLNDPTVSKRHCVIARHENDLVLIDGDMGKPSTNGVFVNRIQVKHKQILKNNDVIQVGPFSITVKLRVAAPQRTAGDFEAVDKTVVTKTSFSDTPPSYVSAPEEVEAVSDFRDEDTGWDARKEPEPTDMVEIEPTEVASKKLGDITSR